MFGGRWSFRSATSSESGKVAFEDAVEKAYRYTSRDARKKETARFFDYLLGEVAWISGSGPPRTHFEAALAAAPANRELAARVYPKLVSFTTHDPTRRTQGVAGHR